VWSVFNLIAIMGFETPDMEYSGVKTAGGSLQGNIPMQTMFAIVNFRGRGT